MMNTNETIFELDKITYSYPMEAPVLNEATLKINRGEKVALLGVNGSGKSTLLKIFSGLIFPQKGVVKFYGNRVTEENFKDEVFAKAYHRKVGFIFQDSDIQLFCSNVEEEIAFAPLQMGLSEGEAMERVNSVIRMLNIEHLRNKTPFKLSGGEKKKVAIASILVINPDVIILDEPTNGLDPRTQRWLVDFLVKLNNAGKTLITSTHNLELVHEISERSIILDENHQIAADIPTISALQDVDLLKRVNLVDDYYHVHSESKHSHFYIHNY